MSVPVIYTAGAPAGLPCAGDDGRQASEKRRHGMTADAARVVVNAHAGGKQCPACVSPFRSECAVFHAAVTSLSPPPPDVDAFERGVASTTSLAPQASAHEPSFCDSTVEVGLADHDMQSGRADARPSPRRRGVVLEGVVA